jgi:hypothetical protein
MTQGSGIVGEKYNNGGKTSTKAKAATHPSGTDEK